MSGKQVRVQTTHFDSAVELTTVVGQKLAAEVANCSLRFLAVSGGRTAASLFDATSAESRRIAADWSAIHLFWADERCVPPDDPESNFRVALQHLIRPLNLPEHQVHRIRGEMDPTEATRAAEDELQRVTGGSPLDLVLLGMGEDGHIASLFPDRKPDGEEVFRSYLPVVGPKPPRQRITLSYQALAGSGRVWVVVAGSGKATALEAALRGEKEVSLGRLIAMRDSTQLFAAV